MLNKKIYLLSSFLQSNTHKCMCLATRLYGTYVKMLVDKLCLCVNICTHIPIEDLPQLIGLLWLIDHHQNHDKRWSSPRADILIFLTNMFNISANRRHIILPSWDLVMSKQWKRNSTVKHTKGLCVTALAKRVLYA